MAVTASVQPESGRIVCQIRLPGSVSVPFFHMDHIAQNRPGSDLDGLVRVLPDASGLEARWCAGIIGPGFWQDATGPLPVPTFRLGSVISQTSRIILCKTSPDPIQFWLTASGFGPNGSGPEASRCATIIRPASGQCFRADPDRMRIGSGMFTGRPIRFTLMTKVKNKEKLLRVHVVHSKR